MSADMQRVTPTAAEIAATVDADGQPITAKFPRVANPYHSNPFRYDPAPKVVHCPTPRRLGFWATLALELQHMRGDRGFY